VTELSQYVSYALLISGAPNFRYKNPSLPPPPEAAALEDLSPLLANFYQEAQVEQLWKQVQPYYEQALAQYTEPVSRAVLEVNAYMRNATSGFLGRRFQIFVDLVGPPHQIQTRSYLDDYYVVVTPTPVEELPIDEIRHAYLHYVADPLGLKFASDLKKKSALGDYALASPILEEHYRKDFVLLATECFIKAAEARIARRPVMVEQALREGFVLAPAFNELLARYEKQDLAMRLYFPEMVDAIDFSREEKRLDRIDFVSERPARKIRVTAAEKPVELSGPAKTLDEAERAYTDRNLASAKDTYMRLLRETEEKPMQAKAYYGLARIAVLERDPETGDKLFRKVLELEPDASTHSWSLLYLGRLADSQGEREEAQEFYKAVLAVPGVPESVRQAAEKGLKEAFTRN
jgi:tetratricopeptide (TPR) repeat protein